MNQRLIVLFITFSCLFTLNLSAQTSKRDFYQIQIYRINTASQEAAMDRYLSEAYLPALHRAGIQKVGVFKPIAKDTANFGKQVIVWLPLSAPNQINSLQEILQKDNLYQEAGKLVLAAPYNQPAYNRKESILLKSFPLAPTFKIPSFSTKPADRVYELRSYEGPTENLFRQKVKMFNEGGEIEIFKKLEFNALFYAEVISGSTMPNLMYMTTFADMPTHDQKWNDFRNHPDWKKLSALEEYKNTVSKSVKILLSPTDYSDF